MDGDAISTILEPLVFRIWDDRDKDKVVALLGVIVPQLLPLVQPRTSSRLPHTVKSLSTLVALAEYTEYMHATRKLLWDLFLDEDFFMLDVHALRLWGELVDKLLMRPHEGPQALHELVVGKGSTMFSTRDSETQNRANVLRRLAFALFAGAYDSYAQHAAFIFEKLVESLRMGSRQLVVQVFFVVRVIMVRISPSHTTSMWSLMIPEVTRVLQAPGLDLSLSLAAFKLLDLVLVLNHDGFSCFRWVFLGTQSDGAAAAAAFKPLILSCIPDSTNMLSEDMPLPNSWLSATRRRPVILLQQVQSTSVLWGYAQLLLTIAADQNMKTLQVDTAFVEVMIELELIDQSVDLTQLLASTAKTPQGAAAEEHSINDLQMISDDWMPL